MLGQARERIGTAIVTLSLLMGGCAPERVCVFFGSCTCGPRGLWEETAGDPSEPPWVPPGGDECSARRIGSADCCEDEARDVCHCPGTPACHVDRDLPVCRCGDAVILAIISRGGPEVSSCTSTGPESVCCLVATDDSLVSSCDCGVYNECPPDAVQVDRCDATMVGECAPGMRRVTSCNPRS